MVMTKRIAAFILGICTISTAFGADQGGWWNQVKSFFTPRPKYNYLEPRTQFARRMYKYGLGAKYKPGATAQELVREQYAGVLVPNIEIDEMEPNIARYPYINRLRHRFYAPKSIRNVNLYPFSRTPIHGTPAIDFMSAETGASAPLMQPEFDTAVIDTRSKIEEDMLMKAAQQIDQNRENMRKVRRSFDEGYIDAGVQLRECLTEGPGIGSCGLQEAELNDFRRLEADTNRRFNAIERRNNQAGREIENRLQMLRQQEEDRKWREFEILQEIGKRNK
jgi:hypothetical protein